MVHLALVGALLVAQRNPSFGEPLYAVTGFIVKVWSSVRHGDPSVDVLQTFAELQCRRAGLRVFSAGEALEMLKSDEDERKKNPFVLKKWYQKVADIDIKVDGFDVGGDQWVFTCGTEISMRASIERPRVKGIDFDNWSSARAVIGGGAGIIERVSKSELEDSIRSDITHAIDDVANDWHKANPPGSSVVAVTDLESAARGHRALKGRA